MDLIGPPGCSKGATGGYTWGLDLEASDQPSGKGDHGKGAGKQGRAGERLREPVP